MSELGQLSGFSFPRTRRPWVFRFKLSFVPWTRCPDITLSAGPNVFQRPVSLLIELNVRGCFVIQLSSCCFVRFSCDFVPLRLRTSIIYHRRKTKSSTKIIFFCLFLCLKNPLSHIPSAAFPDYGLKRYYLSGQTDCSESMTGEIHNHVL